MADWNVVLWVLAAQGVLGAFDVLYNHEYVERLPHRPAAAREQLLHGLRETLYPIVFAGLAWYHWQGGYAVALALALFAELVITIWDSLEEDRVRTIAPSERVVHILLSITAGMLYVTIAPQLWTDAQRPTALVAVDHGAMSWLLTFFAFASLAWAWRDLRAARRLHANPKAPMPA